MTLTMYAAPSATSAELTRRVAQLHPLLRRHATQSQRVRDRFEASIEALSSAGVFKLDVPKVFGGHDADRRAWLDVCAVIAEADDAAAWVCTLFNKGAFTVGMFPVHAQEEVYGGDPDARVSGVLAPAGPSRKVPGGWQITGRWYYSSVSWRATWAILGVLLADEAGQITNSGIALGPDAQYRVEETWFSVGTRDSASNCVVIDDVFVPENQVVSVSDGSAGLTTDTRDPRPLFHSSLAAVLSLILIGPQLGMARAALQLVPGQAGEKPIAYAFIDSPAASRAFQLRLAEAAMKIDTAYLHAYRAADTVDRAAASCEPLATIDRARVRAGTGYVADTVVDAINILLSAHGVACFTDPMTLQRISNTTSRHALVASAVGLELLGVALLGVAQQFTPVI